ncbi:hypothetical protein PR001_g21014 [Phytophthora rubi]|uniref:Uncharacterized protein n=1 Tax=Phytophthora rubi TaxID=129364 RepID=A0A6A3JFD7_9STRA|nr:hypothetical protein PR001_g21014 [Phytophthora rubi]
MTCIIDYRSKVRTLVLPDQAPESPAAEQKQGVGARFATTRSIGVGSAYNSAASDAGDESAGDTEDKKTDTQSQETSKK